MVSHVICVIPRMSFGASGKPVETEKLIQLLVKSNHTDDGKLERTRYLPWFSLFPKNSHVR